MKNDPTPSTPGFGPAWKNGKPALATGATAPGFATGAGSGPGGPPARSYDTGRSGRDDPAAPQSTPEGQAIEDGSRSGTGNDGDTSRSAKTGAAAEAKRKTREP